MGFPFILSFPCTLYTEDRDRLTCKVSPSGFGWLHALDAAQHFPLSPEFPAKWQLDPKTWSATKVITLASLWVSLHSFIRGHTMSHFHSFLKFNFYFIICWSIVDLQCCISIRCIAKWLFYIYAYLYLYLYLSIYIYIYISFFFQDSFPRWVVTRYWVEFSVLFLMLADTDANA